MDRPTATIRRASAAARIPSELFAVVVATFFAIGCSDAAPEATSEDDAAAVDAADGGRKIPIIDWWDLMDGGADATVPPDADPIGDAATDTPDGWCPTYPAARPNEGLVEAPGDPGCPKGMLKIASSPAFCVDRYEGSIVNADGTSWSPYYPPPAASGATYRAVSLKGAVPQGYISGEKAQKACTNAGKRLCTNTEWLRACRGPSSNTYPYGNTREPGVCNDARSLHPAVQCFDSSASWVFSHLDYPGINQQPDTVDKTGANTGCVTSEGAYDMMGNLHEWIYDDPSKYADPVKAIDFRGGFYADTKLNGEGCLYQTTAHNFLHWDYSTGFRCCADAT